MREALAVSDTRFTLGGESVALSAADASVPSEFEVILSGQYKTRNFAIDDKAIDSMIANHKAAGVDPAVDREHESWAMLSLEPSPAMGWVKALSKRPSAADPSRSALVATVEWTDVGAKAVAAKHYRYISAGIDLAAKDRLSGKAIGVMLDHVALVKHPFVQGMQPLSLSAVEPPTKENRMKPVLLALGLKDDASEADAVAALSSLSEKLTAKDAEIVALKAKTSADDTRIAALELDAKAQKLARLESKLDAKIAAFCVDPAEKAVLMELATVSPELFEKQIALRTARNPGGPKLVTQKSLDRKALQAKAIESFIALNKSASYDEAFIACATESPDLFTDEVA